MRFAVMKWVGKGSKNGSIFGVLDEKIDRPVLPMISDTGHWEDYRRIDEDRFPLADEAKKSIAEHGYYLMGASVTIKEAFGEP